MSSLAIATVALPPAWAEERAAWAAERAALHERIARLEQRLAWFERQLFGEKSERRRLEPPPEQLSLGAGLGDAAPAVVPPQTVAAHQRRPRVRGTGEAEEPALFFDPERVPVETVAVPNPEIADLPPEAYEVIGEKVTHRLAQRPGSDVVLKYVRPLVKLKASGALSCPSAPRRCSRAAAPM